MSRFSRVCCGMPAAAASTDLTIHLICVMPAVSVVSFNEWADPRPDRSPDAWPWSPAIGERGLVGAEGWVGGLWITWTGCAVWRSTTGPLPGTASAEPALIPEQLGARTLALVRLAGLIAVGGAVPSYGAQADAAVDAGATAAEIVDVLVGLCWLSAFTAITVAT